MPDFRPGRPGAGPNARMNVEKPKHMRKTIARLLRYIGRNGMLLVVLLFFMLMTTVVDLLGPMFQQLAIDTIKVADEGLSIDLQALFTYLTIMGIAFVFGALMNLCQSLLSAKLSQSTIYAMRSDLFRKISKLPISYTDSHRHGDIMSRMTNDVENVSNAVAQSVTTLISCVITIVGALVMMIYYSWELTLITLVTIPLSITVSTLLGKFMRKYFVRRQKLLGQLNGQVEEMVTSYKTVVAYGKESEAVEQFRQVSDQLRKSSISARVWGSIMGPLMNFIGNLQYVAVAVLGGFMMLTGRRPLTPGKLQAMLQYSKKFTMPVNQVANQYSAILTALAGAERIFEIMDSDDEIDAGTCSLCREDMRGAIEFSDVHFSYVPGEPVLRGFDLSVKPGQKIAIVGATGSGKTTVVNLLTRFYEPDSGSITVDGISIADIPKEQLRRSIAIVLQDTVLFCDSIRQNILYGRLDADEREVRAAAAMANADRFIERLPESYDTQLSEAGSNLSQGQRQLLSIARAVLADPKILILDEATSSVDTRTEMRIQQAMINLMQNRTSLIIAHRLSTIRDADVIVVLRDGVIAEAGNHDTLLAAGGEYAKLYSNQFAGVAT
ncbi:MAG: ABC transporter ATP-binding protein [Ruminococcaceae bacterium]|nr:ABC transporter ATP-binding protein [Oscillospiraceae bacterium]